MAVIFAYLIFDILELGSLGIQLFLAVFGLACLAALTSIEHAVHPSGILASLETLLGNDPNTLLVYGLLVCSVMLVLNVLLDVMVLGRTSMMRAR